jgi:hypothetical protein
MHASPKTRVSAALAAAALGTGVIAATATLASASPGHQPGPHPTHSMSHPAKLEPTRLSIRNKVIAHARHHADAITGVLTADDMGVPGETVVLEARSGKMPHWHVVATGVTGAGGAVTFAVAPKAKTQYKIVFAGDTHFRASASNVITLKIVR